MSEPATDAIDLQRVRTFIRDNGPVRVARRAGLAKATLLRFEDPDWNPSWSTASAVSRLMREDSKADAAA